jgi:hypothetical protein
VEPRPPWYSHKPLFYGEGLKTDRLLSYAASFGNYDAERGLDDFWAEKLARFTAVSVRDDNSRRWSSKRSGAARRWCSIPACSSPIASRATGGRAGALRPALRPRLSRLARPVAQRWARRGLKLLSIGYGNELADEEWIDAGPLDFARHGRWAPKR